MKEWEVKYKEYKSRKMNARIKELKEKVDKKEATKEEYKEYEEKSKIKGNIKKIDNILEFRTKLQEELSKVKDELARREALVEANLEKDKLEEELKKIEIRKEEVLKQLKDPSLTDEQKDKLQEEKDKLDNNITENNSKFAENQKKFEKNLSSDEELSKLSKEELEQSKFEIASKISKCNMVAKSLFNGLSWDSIELKLNNWQDRKFTSSKIPINRKEKAEEQKDFEDIVSDQEKLKENEKLRLARQSEFARKHPKLAKVANWFKTKFENMFNREEVKLEEVKLEEVKPEEVEKESNREFAEYLKEIAEKGIDKKQKEAAELKAKKEAELKANKEAELKAKYEANKAAAHERETIKFGKDYADKSFKKGGEGR